MPKVGSSANFTHRYVTLAEKTVNWNLPHNKDPVFGIHASLPHHRLDVSLLVMPLIFEYEKKEYHNLFYSQKAHSPLAEDLCTDLYIIGGTASHRAKTKASQSKVLFLVINVHVIFALTYP